MLPQITHQNDMSIDGILNINKPEGITSFSVVSHLRRLTGEKHVGHAGTLDPIATGVLPICFGQGTRVTQFLMNSSKTYLAEIELGISTDTFDREGKVMHRGDPGKITRSQIDDTLCEFLGVTPQVPPIYSALKHKGKKYYELARAGTAIQLEPRQVQIYSIELLHYTSPLITIEVECSKGTYIRSLAHDLGQRLGCYAHLKNLTRTKYGGFLIEDAIELVQVEEAIQKCNWQDLLYPIDSPLLNLKAAIVDIDCERAIRNGQAVPLGIRSPTKEEYCRAYSQDGHLIALLHFASDKNLWHPEKVFPISELLAQGATEA